METREMGFEAKRLFKLAIGPVLMLVATFSAAAEVNQMNNVAWRDGSRQRDFRVA
jgi:hypothetical protein